MPRDWRVYDRVRPPIEYGAACEAIRSPEVLTQVAIGFDIMERRDHGGTLLSILVPVMNWNIAPAELQQSLIAAGAGVRDRLAQAMGKTVPSNVTARYRPDRAARGCLRNTSDRTCGD